MKARYIIHEKSRRQLCGSAIFAAVALTSAVFLYAEQWDEIAALEQKITLTDSKITAVNNFLQKHGDLQDYGEKLTARRQMAERLFWPAAEDDAEFPAMINYLAGRFALRLENLAAVSSETNAENSKQDSLTPPKAAKQNIAADENRLNYTTKEFQIAVSGKFWQIVDFMAELEKGEPLVSVTQWNLKEKAAGGESGDNLHGGNDDRLNGAREKTLTLTARVVFYKLLP